MKTGCKIVMSAAGLAGFAGMLAGCGSFGKAQAPATNSEVVFSTPVPTRVAEPSPAPQPQQSSVQMAPRPESAPSYDYGPSRDDSPAFEVVSPREAPTTTNVGRVTFADEGADFDPSVSKDGSHIVFASTQHRTTADLYIKRTDSRVVTQLTNDPGQDAMPVISPDGNRIAFASDRSGNWDIYVMPINGGKAVQITSDTSDEIHPSWSPDGKELVFDRMGQASGRWEMWTIEVQNPSVQNFIGYGLLPQWCPVAATGENGSDRILFQMGKERGQRAFSIWTIDVGSGGALNATEICNSPTTALINPTWSPDGRWIAYAEVPIPDAPSSAAIATTNTVRPSWSTLWMVSVEGEGRVRLTTGPGVPLSPTWGANNRLYFVWNRSGTDNVWSLDISPAVAAAQGTVGGGPVVAHAAPANAPKNDAIANVPENDAASHAAPR